MYSRFIYTPDLYTPGLYTPGLYILKVCILQVHNLHIGVESTGSESTLRLKVEAGGLVAEQGSSSQVPWCVSGSLVLFKPGEGKYPSLTPSDIYIVESLHYRLGTFPTSQGDFPKWQHPKCAISLTSQFCPSRSVRTPSLFSRSTRPPNLS